MSAFLEILTKLGIIIAAATTIAYGLYLISECNGYGWGFVSIGLTLITVDQIWEKINR